MLLKLIAKHTSFFSGIAYLRVITLKNSLCSNHAKLGGGISSKQRYLVKNKYEEITTSHRLKKAYVQILKLISPARTMPQTTVITEFQTKHTHTQVFSHFGP